MTTIILILAAVFVGYALYAIYTSGTPDYMTPKTSSKQEESEARAIVEAASEQPIPAEKLPEETTSATEAEVESPAAESGEETPAAEGKEKTVAADPAKITEFRNPETGETAANPSNYRFAKKWIKQAMVNEGLLEKVFKNKELKGATDKKVKEALNQFKQLEKYHA